MDDLHKPSSDSSSSDHEEQEQPQDNEDQQTTSPEQPSSSQQPSPPSQDQTLIPPKPKRAPPQPKAQIISHLESLLQDIATALETSNHNPLLPPWSTHFHPTFTAEVGALANSASKTKIPLHDFLLFTAERRRQNPEYRMRVTGVHTNVNTRRGKAESFVNLELSGVPVGIVRPSVASVGFECVEGRWWFVRWGSLRGGGGFE
ncbi:hypothetical protein M409DRAFT_54292 [Zasmidium cellare ATCC 36951]|uniref:Uncharacterized protein n=1 Tax=Zasmidium cellare ATCC 36951 TaxID=1080233 RepID=A0A6A6CNP3_ZASCE|nr:uncharacterized protein M409DRAFT_54292 [Zasmidium cellare ATCC 36951]KAF2167086.1 hypothetical protein M409DRAFT_54292 [Zasmidium cellare ATCC 36951]